MNLVLESSTSNLVHEIWYLYIKHCWYSKVNEDFTQNLSTIPCSTTFPLPRIKKYLVTFFLKQTATSPLIFFTCMWKIFLLNFPPSLSIPVGLLSSFLSSFCDKISISSAWNQLGTSHKQKGRRRTRVATRWIKRKLMESI